MTKYVDSKKDTHSTNYNTNQLNNLNNKKENILDQNEEIEKKDDQENMIQEDSQIELSLCKDLINEGM